MKVVKQVLSCMPRQQGDLALLGSVNLCFHIFVYPTMKTLVEAWTEIG